MKGLRGLFDRVRAWFVGFALARAASRFTVYLAADSREAFLERLLGLMNLALLADHRYRRNIETYRGVYVFQSKDQATVMSVVFEAGRMTVRTGVIAEPDITVTFNDDEALANFLLGERIDLIGSIVDNEIAYVGNLNYLRKLAYMAKQLQLEYAPAQRPDQLTHYRGQNPAICAAPATVGPSR